MAPEHVGTVVPQPCWRVRAGDRGRSGKTGARPAPTRAASLGFRW